MTEEETVRLWGGPRVSVEALRLALSIEQRDTTGVAFVVEADDQLRVTPALSEEDRAAIRRYKTDLIKIVRYRAPTVPLSGNEVSDGGE